MTSSARITLAALALSCATALSAPAAHALTAKECHQSFAAARTAGTLNGKSYKEFKAATCDAPAGAATTAPTASAPKETAPATAPAATTGTTPTEAAKPATTRQFKRRDLSVRRCLSIRQPERRQRPNEDLSRPV